ncbi:uncharacterized protein LOC123196997 [Mangifera indica]|uniref:uncharacterized protein LOC123196997 n=1 Tax=Mangifera indica TaxID=29780 RepID=UPI001CF9BB7D|nr:uncharacterized protein LOC123196997 [Mangifera indica]
MRSLAPASTVHMKYWREYDRWPISYAYPKEPKYTLFFICRNCKNVSLKWDSLETLRIDSCMALKTFPATFQRAEKLIAIYCTLNLWNQVDWLDVTDVTKNRFQNLYKHMRPWICGWVLAVRYGKSVIFQ